MGRSALTKTWFILSFIVLVAGFPVIHSMAQPNEHPTAPFSFKKCWQYNTSGLNESGIAADNLSIYLSEPDARIESVSADTGARLWASDLGGKIVSNMFVGDTDVYIATRSEGSSENHTTLRALSKETGVTIFTSPLNGSGEFVLAGSGKRVFAVSNGMVSAFDAVTGSTLWNRAFTGMVSAKPIIAADRIVVATNENLVLAISVGNGEVISKTKTQFLPTAIALPDANTLIIGDERGYVWSNPINSDESNWKLRQGAKISDIDLNGDKLLVTSFDNFIYSVNAENGRVLWKKRMPGRVNAKSDGSKDLAVTVSYGENTAFVINTKNGKSLNQLVLEGENSFVQGPVITNNSAVFATTDGVFGYGMTGCSAK